MAGRLELVDRIAGGECLLLARPADRRLRAAADRPRPPCWPGSAPAGSTRPCPGSPSAPRAAAPRPSPEPGRPGPARRAYRFSILSRTSSSVGDVARARSACRPTRSDAGHALLHLGLLELAEQLGPFGQPLAEQHLVVLDRLPGLLRPRRAPGRAGSSGRRGRLLGRDQLGGEGLRGLLVVAAFVLVAAGPGPSARTSACRALACRFSTSVELAGELHLQLTLVADDRRGLLEQ